MTHNKLAKMTEEELRDYKTPWPKTFEELSEIIKVLTGRSHDYGTTVYAMSIAATATFNYVAHELGVSGFQASCADMDILTRTRHLKRFRIQDLEHLLYPQYEESFDGWHQLLEEHRDWLAEEAAKLLKDTKGVHKDVVQHWQMLTEKA